MGEKDFQTSKLACLLLPCLVFEGKQKGSTSDTQHNYVLPYAELLC
jgi:hypothetical protein